MTIRYGSLCSGIEAASVAWEPLGWQPAWFAEIEPFPCAVLSHHWPHVPNHGDMTHLVGKILNGSIEAPDILVGGTPCQAFSVAGLRGSLDDERGNLTLTLIRILDAIDFIRARNGQPPCILVWENVPGVLSTKDNAFGCFLGGLAGEDMPLVPVWQKWTSAGCVLGHKRRIAWRMDSEFRRKPETIKVGKWEFPKPIGSPPRDGETYWIVRAYFHTEAGHVPDSKIWCGDEADYGYLKVNICHLSKEAAQAHADVLNAICRGDVE